MVNSPGGRFDDEQLPVRDLEMEPPIYEIIKGPILTEKQIMDIILQHAPNCTIARKLSDDAGIYLVEGDIPGENPGERTQYRYERKGIYGENQFTATSITVVYFEGDDAVGGKTLASFNESTGMWRIGGR